LPPVIAVVTSCAGLDDSRRRGNVIDNSDQVNDAAERLARREIDARAKRPRTISRECLVSLYATRIG
jgi:hypothetical protein